MMALSLETGNNILPLAQHFDASFLQQDHSEGILLVHLGNRNLSYTIFDKVTGTFEGLASYAAKPAQTDLSFHQEALSLLAKEAIFKSTFKKVAIAVQAETNTLVAKTLYHESEQANYLQFNLSNPKHADIEADLVEAADAYCVYSLPRNLVALLDRVFPAPKVIDADVPFINGLLKEHHRDKENCLFLDVQEGQLKVLAIEKGKLALFNTYPAGKETDILYFALAVCDQLGFNPAYVKVKLLGTVKQGDATYQLLDEHFTHLQFGQRPQAYKYAHTIGKVPGHQYYPLFSLLSCVL